MTNLTITPASISSNSSGTTPKKNFLHKFFQLICCKNANAVNPASTEIHIPTCRAPANTASSNNLPNLDPNATQPEPKLSNQANQAPGPQLPPEISRSSTEPRGAKERHDLGDIGDKNIIDDETIRSLCNPSHTATTLEDAYDDCLARYNELKKGSEAKEGSEAIEQFLRRVLKSLALNEKSSPDLLVRLKTAAIFLNKVDRDVVNRCIDYNPNFTKVSDKSICSFDSDKASSEPNPTAIERDSSPKIIYMSKKGQTTPQPGTKDLELRNPAVSLTTINSKLYSLGKAELARIIEDYEKNKPGGTGAGVVQLTEAELEIMSIVNERKRAGLNSNADYSGESESDSDIISVNPLDVEP